MKLGRSAVDRAPPAPRTGRWACGPRLTSWTGHVSLRPGGASPFLRLPLAETRNQIVSLDAIRGRARAAPLHGRQARAIVPKSARFGKTTARLLIHTFGAWGLRAEAHEGWPFVSPLAWALGVAAAGRWAKGLCYRNLNTR